MKEAWDRVRGWVRRHLRRRPRPGGPVPAAMREPWSRVGYDVIALHIDRATPGGAL